MKSIHKIICVRHGESEGNVQGDVTGSDPVLTDRGREQAQQLGSVLRMTGIDAIFASDLKRAKETAEIVGTILNLPIVQTPKLRERFFGSIEGLMHDEVVRLHGKNWLDFYDLPHEQQMQWKLDPTMESYDEVFRRVTEWFDEACKTEPRTILAVTHANVMLSILTNLGFARLADLPRGSISNTGMIELTKTPDGWAISNLVGITRKQQSTILPEKG